MQSFVVSKLVRKNFFQAIELNEILHRDLGAQQRIEALEDDALMLGDALDLEAEVRSPVIDIGSRVMRHWLSKSYS